MANSLAHTKWVCKYHIVFTPKYRRKVIYYQLRKDIREIIKDLCKWKGVEIIEGAVMPDHIHAESTPFSWSARMRVPKVLCLGYSPMGKTQIPFKELDMKRKILALAAAAILAATGVSGSIAYFTAEDTAHNIITTAGIDIAIEEWQETENGLLLYPDEAVRIMPGTVVSKIALVRNDDEKAFVRAKFEIVVFDQDGNIMEIAEDELKYIIRIETGEKWTEKDGWYYYDEAVLTGEKTEPLFTEVHFDGPMMTNEYQNCAVEVIVKAQGVQTANNGASALEAAGWPAEE